MDPPTSSTTPSSFEAEKQDDEIAFDVRGDSELTWTPRNNGLQTGAELALGEIRRRPRIKISDQTKWHQDEITVMFELERILHGSEKWRFIATQLARLFIRRTAHSHFECYDQWMERELLVGLGNASGDWDAVAENLNNRWPHNSRRDAAYCKELYDIENSRRTALTSIPLAGRVRVKITKPMPHQVHDISVNLQSEGEEIEWPVKDILDWRLVDHEVQLRVRWAATPTSSETDSWEPWANLNQTEKAATYFRNNRRVIQAFCREVKRKD